jgi:hypothetical protein
MPSARTSVGNKEYEYKGNKQRGASMQPSGNRQETVSMSAATLAVALRHEIETTVVRSALSTLFLMHANFCDKWTYRRPDVQKRLLGRSLRESWSDAGELSLCATFLRIAAKKASVAAAWRRI